MTPGFSPKPAFFHFNGREEFSAAAAQPPQKFLDNTILHISVHFSFSSSHRYHLISTAYPLSFIQPPIHFHHAIASILASLLRRPLFHAVSPHFQLFESVSTSSPLRSTDLFKHDGGTSGRRGPNRIQLSHQAGSRYAPHTVPTATTIRIVYSVDNSVPHRYPIRSSRPNRTGRQWLFGKEEGFRLDRLLGRNQHKSSTSSAPQRTPNLDLSCFCCDSY